MTKERHNADGRPYSLRDVAAELACHAERAALFGVSRCLDAWRIARADSEMAVDSSLWLRLVRAETCQNESVTL